MTKSEASNPNKDRSHKSERVYDLEERTAVFGEAVISFAGRLPRSPVVLPLISQVVRSATSVGANYVEADGAESGKDFRHRIAICRREAHETRHWLRMVATAHPDAAAECRVLGQEAQELTLIFASIYRKKSLEQ